MNIDDDLGFTQFLGQALVVPAEFLHFLFLRITFGLGAALVRGQSLENAGLPLATPSDQVRGVKTFAAQQGADGAGLCGGGVGLSQDAQFVFGGEGSALGTGDNLRVGRGRAGASGATVLPAAALRAASLRSASLRSAAGKTVGEAEEIPLFFTLIPVLALLSNYDQENCLINVGTEGLVHQGKNG